MTIGFFGTGTTAIGGFDAPSSAKLAGGAALDWEVTSTANALLGAAGFEGGFNDGLSASLPEEKAGGAAAVFAAPSTADNLVGATGADDFEAPCFGGALLESELTTPAGS